MLWTTKTSRMISSFPKENSHWALADWLEVKILSGSKWTASESKVERLLEDEDLDSLITFIPSALSTLTSREQKLKAGYPIEQIGQHYRQRKEASDLHTLYKALLFISQADLSANTERSGVLGSHFEQI